jgi:hypothetical protein
MNKLARILIQVRLWRLLLAAAPLVLLAACAAPTIGTPSAQEIAAKPSQSNLKDAHFTLAGQVTSGAADVQMRGEGLMVFRPATASRMILTGSVGVIPIAVELISVHGVDYERAGNAKWTKTTSNAKPASKFGISGQAAVGSTAGLDMWGNGGQRPPRASIARAIKASAEWKPKARRVMRRSFGPTI